MSAACRSCGERKPHLRRGCCPKCVKLIRSGDVPDVRAPRVESTYGWGVRSPEAVRKRRDATLARYPHLREPS